MLNGGDNNMGLKETFYNWAKQYDAPEILNERNGGTPPYIPANLGTQQQAFVKPKRSTTSFAAASPYNPTIPPQGGSGWYDMHPIPENWANLLNNMGIDWNTYPINWSGILPFLNEGPEGTWSGQGPGGITYTVQAFFGVTGEFVGWMFS